MRKHVQIGEKYNYLTVIKRVENHKTASGISFSKWQCKCDCGNLVNVLGSSLTSGHTKSCGCLSKRHKVHDDEMLNKKFGTLTVVSRAPSHKIPSGSVYDMWNCICDCGNTTVSFGRNLRNGTTSSCGCKRVINQSKAKRTPKAELWLLDYLKENDIEFEYQKTFYDLCGVNGGLLSYDFYIPSKNMLIELNGLQHYDSIAWFGGDETLIKQLKHDELKEQYTKYNNYYFHIIKTNRISYKRFMNEIHNIGL